MLLKIIREHNELILSLTGILINRQIDALYWTLRGNAELLNQSAWPSLSGPFLFFFYSGLRRNLNSNKENPLAMSYPISNQTWTKTHCISIWCREKESDRHIWEKWGHCSVISLFCPFFTKSWDLTHTTPNHYHDLRPEVIVTQNHIITQKESFNLQTTHLPSVLTLTCHFILRATIYLIFHCTYSELRAPLYYLFKYNT